MEACTAACWVDRFVLPPIAAARLIDTPGWWTQCETRAYGTARCASKFIGRRSLLERMQALAEPRNSTDNDIPKIQRRKSRKLAQRLESCENREQALYNAHTHSAMAMSVIGRDL